MISRTRKALKAILRLALGVILPLLCAASALANPAAVEPGKDVVLLVEDKDWILVRLLRHELNALGFVPHIRVHAAVDSTAFVLPAAPVRHVEAVLRVVHNGTRVQVWVQEDSSPHPAPHLIGTLAPQREAEDAYQLLAIRTGELLRATLFDVRVIRRAKAEAAAAKGEPRPAPASTSYGPLPGGGVFAGPGDIDPTVHLRLGAYWAPADWLRTTIEGSVPVLSPRVVAPDGEATIHQSLLQVGASWLMLSPTRRLRPRLGLDVGALHTSVRATVVSAAEIQQKTRLRVLTRSHFGLTWGINETLMLDFATWVGAAPERVTLKFNDRVVATSGPLFLGADLSLLLEL